MLRNMFIGNPPGNYDRILDFSTAVTGTLFFVPTADFLDDPPGPPAAAAEPAAATAAAVTRPARRNRCGIGSLKRSSRMNNLHRELAPISDAAWADIEDEARRTFTRHVAGRRVVDVIGPEGLSWPPSAPAISPRLGVPAAGRAGRAAAIAQPIVELRVPFAVDRQAVDDVERGAKDADWQPVKDAAKHIAFAEDRAVFRRLRRGRASPGSGQAPPTRRSTLPADVRELSRPPSRRR